VTPRQRAVLLGILLVAAALRFWGLDLVLPNVDGRPDEREMLLHTAAFPSGDLNPRWFVYPNLFMYVAWLWIEGGLAVRRLWTATPGYAEALRDALPTVLLSGRLLSAVAGTLTVAVVYRVAARNAGATRGLIAAGLLAVCWLHVRDSHFLKTEALLAGAAVLAIAALARWVERGLPRDAILAGLIIGLAMGIKYPAVFLFVPAWVADVLRARQRSESLAFIPSRDLVLLGATAALTFLVTNPYLLLDLGRTRDTASFLGLALYAERPGSTASADGLGALTAWIRSRAFGYHLTHSLRYGCGLLQTLALPVVLGWVLVRRREPLLVLTAVFCVTLFLVAGASPVHLARYVTPLTPLIAILLAEGVMAASSLAMPVRRRALLAMSLLAGLGAEPLWASIQGDRIAAREDTRVQATAWMQQTLRPNARVAVLGTVLLPQGAPRLPAGVTGAAVPPTPEAYAAAGVTHVLTHEHPLMFSRVDPAVMTRLTPTLRLVAEFSPFADDVTGGFEAEDAYYLPFFAFGGVVRPGPHIRIYAVVPSPS
jgi:4-amino-4-deoxy-L-arabinose transferase-like glycosyltransferase